MRKEKKYKLQTRYIRKRKHEFIRTIMIKQKYRKYEPQDLSYKAHRRKNINRMFKD